jgi:UDP-N-acetylglucosamine 2-epimerase
MPAPVPVPAHLPRIVFVLGTRPEAIKLAPVVHAARAHDDWSIRILSTGQHRELLLPFLHDLDLHPDVALDVMRADQSLCALLGRLVEGLDAALVREAPDWIVVQGDTTTVLAAALAAFHRRIRVAHVEAGLRTHDLAAPFPEEANRTLAARLADLHLAPTARAVANLRAEGIDPARIVLTGNTIVDAVRAAIARLPPDGAPPPSEPALGDLGARTLVLVTGHRRESFGGGLAEICEGLRELARRHGGVDFVYPVHLNPAVRAEVDARLRAIANVRVIEPVGYAGAVWLLARARFVVTDSGGIQEEAPELGKPVLVTRVATERPEVVEAGGAVVIGYDRARLVELASSWLVDDAAYEAARPRSNPFGDGRAGARCVGALRDRLGLRREALPALAE